MSAGRAAAPLRVVHVDTERGWRGGQRQALWLAAGLAARDHASVLVARRGEPLFARAKGEGIRVEAAAPRFEADPVAAWRLRGLLRALDAAIVHAHSSHAAGLAAIATLGLRTRLVVARRVIFPLKRNRGTRWKYGRADAVIAVSAAVAAVVRAGGVPADRIHVVPDATDLSRDRAPANAVTLAELGLRPAAPLVVQVGQLGRDKDPLTFVRAVAAARTRVPDLQALLVGDGPLRPDVEAEIARLDLGATLKLAGFRTDADRLLASADVAVLSSREEGMGSVLLDAALFGVPVVGTDAGGIPEVVLDGRTGIVVPRESPQPMGEAIARLVLDRSLARRMGEEAARHVREYSIERMVERTEAVYRAVLEPR